MNITRSCLKSGLYSLLEKVESNLCINLNPCRTRSEYYNIVNRPNTKSTSTSYRCKHSRFAYRLRNRHRSSDKPAKNFKCYFRPFINRLLHQLAPSVLITKRLYSQDVLHASGTIFAVCSGIGKCGVTIIRVSGTQTSLSLKEIAQMRTLPKPRTAIYRRLVDPDTKEPIDRGLLLWFPGPESFTGEDTVEFHVHGGPAVVSAMLTTLGKLPDMRLAEPGEFTKRAFMNGKLDLTEVEGLGDLVQAETEAQHRQALRQMEGNLHTLYDNWKSRILKCMANVEAYIDFSEDQNIEEDILSAVSEEVDKITLEVRKHLADNRRGERLRNGVRVAIFGKPNVGKSSLLNVITQRPAAIVSPLPGTTRDIVETSVNLGGYPVLFSDTAGLRETSDIVEQEGVRRAISRASEADIKVLVIEAPLISTQDKSIEDIVHIGLHEHEILLNTSKFHMQIDNESYNNHDHTETNYKSEINDCLHNNTQNSSESEKNNCLVDNTLLRERDLIIVFNKCDLVDDSARQLHTFQLGNVKDDSVKTCSISCLTGDGIDEFLQLLTDKVRDMCDCSSAGTPSLTQVRHRNHLTQCLNQLQSFEQRMKEDDVVLAAQSLRRALRELGRIMGHVTSEDILDVIFRDFCIGK